MLQIKILTYCTLDLYVFKIYAKSKISTSSVKMREKGKISQGVDVKNISDSLRRV